MTIRPSHRERSSRNDGKSGAGVMRFWSLCCRRWNSYSDQNAFTRAEQCGCYLGAQFHLTSLETLSWTASSPHNQPSDSSGLDFGSMAGVRGPSISSATAILHSKSIFACRSCRLWEYSQRWLPDLHRCLPDYWTDRTVTRLQFNKYYES